MEPIERAPRIADRLAAARRERFVGRQAEKATFRNALLADPPPFVALHIHGPGGVGKSTLLRELERVAQESGWTAVRVDGRNIAATPEALLRAIPYSVGLGDEDDQRKPPFPPRGALFIDTYERLETIDDWLRETLLPALPDGALVVIASRNQPDPAWRTDLDWADLTRTIHLGNFDHAESATFLATRGVPEDEHLAVLRFTHGHPLALALVVDARRRGERVEGMLRPDDPDVVRSLLDRMVESLPDARHRRALDAAVITRVMTEDLLAQALDIPDARDLFDWLQGLSFMEHGPYGVFPHDVAREALAADARWRDYSGTMALSRRIYALLRQRVDSATGEEKLRAQFDAIHALRVNPLNSEYFDWESLDAVRAAPLAPGDDGAIRAWVRAHEGAESAAIVDHWLRVQPDAFLVFHHVGGPRFGFMAHLRLRHATDEDARVDPAVRAALDFVERYGPAGDHEEIVHLRFWMHETQYQQITAAINLAAINVVSVWMTHPSLAWNFIAMADADFWTPHFTENNVPPAPEAGFVVGGRRYAVFAHDWRVEPPSMWVAMTRKPMPWVGGPTAAAAPALTRDEFASAVRQALRDFTRPDRLATNSLLADPAVRAALSHDASPEPLRALIREAVDALRSNPRDLRLHRALWHTYIEPAPTQEQAAELLDLPFNTYRYHLNGGLTRVTESLWLRAHPTPPRQ